MNLSHLSKKYFVWLNRNIYDTDIYLFKTIVGRANIHFKRLNPNGDPSLR